MSERAAPLIEAFGLDYFAPGGPESRQILHEVSLAVESGSRIALLGPNGSGKSTLLKRISGVFQNRLGIASQIRFRGRHESELSYSELAREVVYVGPEFRSDFPLSAFDAVSMGRYPHGDRFHSKANDLVHDSMERMGCWQLRFQNMNELSHGERQRVALARAIVQDPKVLFLDEALSQIDLNHQFALEEEIFRWMHERQKSIVVVSHDWNLALRFADTVFLLSQGRMVKAGSALEVVESKEMKQVFSGIGFEYVQRDQKFPAQVRVFRQK